MVVAYIRSVDVFLLTYTCLSIYSYLLTAGLHSSQWHIPHVSILAHPCAIQIPFTEVYQNLPSLCFRFPTPEEQFFVFIFSRLRLESSKRE